MWTPTKTAKYGVGIYNFDGKVRKGLPLEIGETVQILEENGEWFRGLSTRNKSLKGIFPAAYIHLKECQVDVEGPHETVTPIEDPVVREVNYVLREWSTIWKRLYIEGKPPLFGTIRKLMLDLIDCRRQLVSGTLTKDQSRELKARITSKIDWGNRQLGLDLVPRQASEQVDVDRISSIELFNIHLHSTASMQEVSVVDVLEKPMGSLRRRPPRKVRTHHMFCMLRNFGVNVGEETEVYLSVYDAKIGKYFSERFLTRLTKNGMPINLDKGTSALFTDLGNKDLLRDAYLVAHVYRIGCLRDVDSKKAPTRQYRRPYGCAVLDIRDVLMGNLMDLNDQREYPMRVCTSSSEGDFPQLHENIIKKQNNKFTFSSGGNNYGMVVSLKMLHGDLEQVKKEEPLLLKGAAITRKLGFSDVIMPGDVRNDLYLTLTRGEFEKGDLHKKVGKNVEVRVLVLDSEGAIIRDCISAGSGESEMSEYNAVIFYHNDKPRWNETIKLAIPIEQFRGSHIRLEFRHCSTKDKTEKQLFGFSFVKLVADNGTTLSDGSHELYCYKCDETRKLRVAEAYTSLPGSPSEINPSYGTTQGNVIFRRSDKDTMFIDTLLCSTKLTQNADLLGLLNWRSQPDRLNHHLEKLLKLDGEEIVKYLQDILDALFTMFSLENGNRLPQSSLVFQALVYIFQLLEDSKFEHFKPVMDTYISSHFSAPLVYRDLLGCLKERLQAVPSAEKQEPLQACFKVLEYIIKYVVQSRLLFARATGGQEQDEFMSSLGEVFDSISMVLSLHYELITATQCILLCKLRSSCELLTGILPWADVAQQVCRALNSMPAEHKEGCIHKHKLQCIKDLVDSKLFKNQESRSCMMPHFVAQLRHYLNKRQEMKLCAAIMGDILNVLHKEKVEGVNISADMKSLVTAVMDVVVQALLTLDRTSPISGQLVACLVSMLRHMEECHYRSVLEACADRKQLKDFVSRILTVFRELVKQDVFPKDWITMRMVTNNAILMAMQYLSQALHEHFLQGLDFDGKLWSQYFGLAVAFLTQPCLQLEQFSEAKREKIIERYGDMRVQMGYEILSMWQTLGEHKLHFVPSMVGPFLEVTLVPETELRKATLPIFFDMMECEQRARGNFKQVECELIDKLDILVSDNKGDDEYKQLFNTILLGKVQSEPAWQENGTAFIQSVTRLLERLLDYRNVLDGDDNRDKRMTCTVNLLNFYKNEIDRQEMYVRYIYKLRDLHLACDNYTEAGFTLLLHADLLQWSNDMLEADFGYQRQPEWQRKEQLLRAIIKYFDRGKCWENGIPLCKELAEVYEARFDYASLCKILQNQAKFYDKILNELRPEPEYFKVGFFGQSFPLFLRNKVFVYRGDVYERLGTFQQRLQSEFPGATVLSSNNPVSENIKQGDTQCIQICSVKPMPHYTEEFNIHTVPEKILSFYKVNEVDLFQFDRPFHRGTKDDNNEFKTLHCERSLHRTASKLPGILRWFEVLETEVLQLSPIETAIDNMDNMNQELRHLVALHSIDSNRNLNPLSMRLNGVIDAAVNGGISKYQEAFFSNEYVAQNPEHAQYIARLKAMFLEQVQILEGALSLHGRLAPQAVQPLHKRLVELFGNMKQGIKESGSPNMARLLNAMKLEDGNLDVMSCRRASSNSLRSVSPCYTPSPPGSNRSSGVFGESSTDPGEDGDPGALENGGWQGFPSSILLSRRRFSSPLGGLRLPQPLGHRPLSAIYNRSISESSQGSGAHRHTVQRIIASDPSLEVKTPFPDLPTSPSSFSLDSCLGAGRGQGRGHPKLRTNSPIRATLGYSASLSEGPIGPRLPPRKQLSTSEIETRPPLPDRSKSAKRASAPLGTIGTSSSLEKRSTPSTINEEIAMLQGPPPSLPPRQGAVGTPPPIPPKNKPQLPATPTSGQTTPGVNSPEPSSPGILSPSKTSSGMSSGSDSSSPSSSSPQLNSPPPIPSRTSYQHPGKPIPIPRTSADPKH